jgi:aromatic ring hydroxylase
MDGSFTAWGFVLALVVVAYVCMNWKQGQYPVAYVKSNVDGQLYLVRNLPDKQECADRLSRVREKLMRLRTHLDTSHKDKPFVANIIKNFDCTSDRFTESTPEAQYTSYTVNKGDKIHMCLRQRDEKEQLVNENIITFVALHEMAHCGTTSIGHTPDFWNHFAWLLKQAEAMKIYEYTDFSSHPVEYCGIHITDSPTYKETVKDEL